MVAGDWSIEVPAELWKGLIYAVAIATWRDALRESRLLGQRLKGFRPETIPVKELDRVVLKVLDEHPEVRDLALERFAAENAGLLAALEALGPAKAATAVELDRLLRDESAARVFWAAFRGGDPWSAVRDAVLARVRGGRLDGAPLFPPRLERRPKAPPAEVAVEAGRPAEPAAAPPAEELEAIAERLRKAERELARGRDDRERLREEVARLEAAEVRLLADRERLEREVDQLRRERTSETGRRAPAEGARSLGHEVERLRSELADERRHSAAALQRARNLGAELDAARERLEVLDVHEVTFTYPREPGAVSARPEHEKIVWPSDEHHYPKRLRPFLERLARSPYVDRVHIREFEDSTETRFKSIDDRGNILLQYSDGLKAVRLYLTTVAKDANEGRWVLDTIRLLEPSLA